MDNLNADFHIHSKYSHDSLMEPRKIVKRAKKVGLSCIAITDHNTISGALEAKQYEKEYDITVIVGTEILTDIGDLIGLHLSEEIRSRKWEEVIEEIHEQGGLAVLPHPYRSHMEIDAVAKKVDYIEVWNARSSEGENQKALQLGTIKPSHHLRGSDAHLYREIGNVNIRLDLHSWQLKEIISQVYASKADIILSQIVSHVKTGDYERLIKDGFCHIKYKL